MGKSEAGVSTAQYLLKNQVTRQTPMQYGTYSDAKSMLH